MANGSTFIDGALKICGQLGFIWITRKVIQEYKILSSSVASPIC